MTFKHYYDIIGILIFGFRKEILKMKNSVLRYDRSAKIWTDALPLGNGRIGAMVYGRADTEKIQFNEETLWSGYHDDNADNPDCAKYLDEIRGLIFSGKLSEAEALANKYFVCRGNGGGTPGSLPAKDLPYGSYQTAGDLFIKLGEGEINGYSRMLDISTGIAYVNYERGKNKFEHEYFISERLNCFCGRIRANENFNAEFSYRRDDCVIENLGDIIKMHGNFENGIDYAAAVKIVKEDRECRFYVAIKTNYSPNGKLDIDVCGEVFNTVEFASRENFDIIKDESASDMRELMERSTVNLGEDSKICTDELIRLAASGDKTAVNSLSELYYNFGRYLMLSSSRNCVLPANLQGIWTNDYDTIWSADYHININIQMNYWLTELTCLPECGDVFLRYIKFLSEYGKNTAKVCYGMNGWVAHTITNPWGFTAPGNGFSWGSFMCAGAWCCEHIWERWLYSGDIDFLREYYPVLRGACEFFMDFLVEDPNTGYLVTAPSNSPENHYRDPETGKTVAICAGPTMDNSILYELFGNTVSAANELSIDRDFVEKIKAIQKRLVPIKVGKYGQIMEWQEDFEETEPGHRHLSMLYGLHPSGLITKSKTPELFEAAKVSVSRRLSSGGGHTGWSRAWIINFYARLGMGDEAYKHIAALFEKSTYPNLFDSHPPFQIDGNFGGCAGIAEMLLQSHEEFVSLLPALPFEWPNGSFKGIRARGGFIFSAKWSNGKITEIEIIGERGGKCEVRYNDTVKVLTFEVGEKKII